MQVIHNDSTWIDVCMYDIFVVQITRSANYVTDNVVVNARKMRIYPMMSPLNLFQMERIKILGTPSL